MLCLMFNNLYYCSLFRLLLGFYIIIEILSGTLLAVCTFHPAYYILISIISIDKKSFISFSPHLHTHTLIYIVYMSKQM